MMFGLQSTTLESRPTKRAVCCTDVLFLIIFIAFIGGMVGVDYVDIMCDNCFN